MRRNGGTEMELMPVKTHYPPEEEETEREVSIETHLRWIINGYSKLVWKRLLNFSFNNEMPLDVDFHIRYLTQFAAEGEFSGLNDAERNLIIRDGFCSWLCEEEVYQNEYMGKMYVSLCKALGIKKYNSLEKWSFFSAMPKHHTIKIHSDYEMKISEDDWGYMYQLRDLIDVVRKALKEIKSDTRANPSKYENISPDQLLDLSVVHMYTIDPEIVRIFEKIIRLAIQQYHGLS